MVWRSVPRQLLAAAMGSVCLGGCTSAVVQTPTLSYLDRSVGARSHPNDVEPVGYTSGASAKKDRSTRDQDSYALMFSKSEDTDREAVANEFYLHPLPVNLNNYVAFAESWKPSTKDGASAGEVAWRLPSFRDFVQNDLMRRSDQICLAYQTRLVHGYIVGTTTVDATKAALGVVQVFTAPIELLNGAVGQLSGGITATLNGDILKWQSFQDANQRIQLSRRNLRNVIRNAQKLGIDNYSFSQAIYDVERYHSYCNITMAYVGGGDWIGKETNEQIIPYPAGEVAGTTAEKKEPAKVAVSKATTNAPETAKQTGGPAP